MRFLNLNQYVKATKGLVNNGWNDAGFLYTPGGQLAQQLFWRKGRAISVTIFPNCKYKFDCRDLKYNS